MSPKHIAETNNDLIPHCNGLSILLGFYCLHLINLVLKGNT
jgi:hypothetical protein